MISTVLLDLDGVIRHFDPDHVAGVERRHGLPPGSLVTAAFEFALLNQVITGRITRVRWIDQIGLAVSCPAAAEEWLAGRGGTQRGEIDWELVELVDQLRASGIAVAILTNGTDTIPEEMGGLGLSQRFDGIFNSAQIGFAKPDRRVFESVCRSLGVQPSAVFFTDDSPSKLTGANEIGMTTRTFIDLPTFRRHLSELLLSTTQDDLTDQQLLTRMLDDFERQAGPVDETLVAKYTDLLHDERER